MTTVRPIPNEPDLDQPPPHDDTRGRDRHRPPRDVLPHDTEAERSLLGAAMLGAHPVLAKVPDSAFYAPNHGHVAAAIRHLADHHAHIDSVTVGAHLDTLGLLDTIGGPAALADILSNAPSTSGADTYARIVLTHHQARQLIHAAAEATTTARERGPAAALIGLQGALERLTQAGGTNTADPDLESFLDQVDDDYDWLVPGLLEHRDRVILTAEEGTGKSTLLRQLAVQLASGIDPFTQAPIDPFRVLYVDCENTPRQARRALRQLHETAGTDYQPDHLRLRILGEAMALADPNIEADLAARITDQHTDIVIIGPLYKMIDGDPVKEEPAKAVADAIDRLRNIRGTAFIIEAHSPYAADGGRNRPIRPYGASLWSRWPEIGLHLATNGDLKHWRGQRETRAWPHKLEHGSPWPWQPAVHPDDTTAWDGPTQCVEAIVAFLEDAGGTFSLKQMEDRLRERGRGYRRQTIADAARQATHEGRINCKTGARGSLQYSALDLTAEPFEVF